MHEFPINTFPPILLFNIISYYILNFLNEHNLHYLIKFRILKSGSIFNYHHIINTTEFNIKPGTD